jgi:hypothetical protein
MTSNFVAPKSNDQELVLESYPDESTLCGSKNEHNEYMVAVGDNSNSCVS